LVAELLFNHVALESEKSKPSWCHVLCWTPFFQMAGWPCAMFSPELHCSVYWHHTNKKFTLRMPVCDLMFCNSACFWFGNFCHFYFTSPYVMTHTSCPNEEEYGIFVGCLVLKNSTFQTYLRQTVGNAVNPDTQILLNNACNK